MNYLKTSPVGIDFFIDNIQKRIYTTLLEKWGSLDIYGRVYTKTHEEGVSLERYKGDGEYEKVLFSEGNKIFFVQGQKPEINYQTITDDLWGVCVVDIESIINVNHRADEEVHRDLMTALSNAVPGRNIIGLEYGMDNLKRVVEDPFEFGNFKYSDNHPYHVFMVKLNAEYSLIENNC
jgi:predicted DNA-binding ArsR family transcriptional regulator